MAGILRNFQATLKNVFLKIKKYYLRKNRDAGGLNERMINYEWPYLA